MSNTTKMQTYIGTKQVLATPLNRADYNTLRGWFVPDDENPNDEGYLVEYLDGGTPNHIGFAGYISWSPKKQFEDAYRPTTGLTFGLAIEALKLGKRVARAGWNGKGMWLFIIKGSSGLAMKYGYGFGEYLGEPTFRDAIFMKTVDNQLVPWTASQTDVLAEDWCIVEAAKVQGWADSPEAIEAEIQAKGLTAPRVTPADIEANIASERYFTAADGANHKPSSTVWDVATGAVPDELRLLTFCVLVLKNGFTVTGESACASPENFDAEIGRKIARENAVQKVWPLMGYELRTKLANSTNAI